MIIFEDAYKLVVNSSIKTENEYVSLNASLNRILAEDVISDIDMPPFDKSAMDGYACRKEDMHNELQIIEVIQAGKVPKKRIKKNLCSKIMTGAIIPEGADCVLMVEHTENLSKNKIKFIKESSNNNIAFAAEDVKQGDIVLKKGFKIKAQHIAVMAAVGYIKPLVSKKVKLGIISTGNEIVEPNIKPGPSQIRNSNAYQLIAQVEQAGAVPDYIGIARDDMKSSYELIEKAFSKNQVVLISGGVSMGDFDFIPKILNELKIDIKFETIAIQPGKPTVFGVKGNQFVFGLPGNPVSSFNIFELLVKPFLNKMMGADFNPIEIRMPIGKEYRRKKSLRKSFIPVKINSGNVWPIEYHGSAHIFSFTEADGIISIPIGKTIIKKGEIVNVRQI